MSGCPCLRRRTCEALRVRRTPSGKSVVILGLATLVFGAVALHTVLTTQKSLEPAAAVGLGASTLWSAVFIPWRGMWARDQFGWLRSVLGSIALALSLAWLGLLAWTIPRDEPSHINSRLGIATVACGTGMLLTVTALMAVIIWSGRKTLSVLDGHTSTDETEVWHVTGKNLDYYIARCECGWVGETRDIGSGAPDEARHDAIVHNSAASIAVVEIST